MKKTYEQGQLTSRKAENMDTSFSWQHHYFAVELLVSLSVALCTHSGMAWGNDSKENSDREERERERQWNHMQIIRSTRAAH